MARFQDQTVGEPPSSDVAAFGEVTMPLDSVVSKHIAEIEQWRMTAGHGGAFLEPASAEVTFYFSWYTETGVPRTTTREEWIS